MPKGLMQCLSTFQPNDRKLLSRELGNESTRDTAIDAIEGFVVRWKKADWLDGNSISRIGRWLAI